MERKYFLGLLLIAGIALLVFRGGKNNEVKTVSNLAVTKEIGNNGSIVPTKTTRQEGVPEMQIDTKKQYTVVLKTTMGDISVNLSADKTPITVNNFISLARRGFYDNTIFHRAIKGFMIQGGDPVGDGTGGPGYRFADEPFVGEYTRGTVAMANSGPNTNGSQFFILHQDYPLPKNYVIFGQVVDGLDTVDKIAEAPVEISASGESSKPVSPVMVKSVEVIEK